MTPAESAVNNHISFECKKDRLFQMQNDDWKITFTVQGVDMDERITRAPMGTRFVAVLVAINDDEMPVQQPAKETKAPETVSPATPRRRLEKPAGAKLDWKARNVSQQAYLTGCSPVFWAFLTEAKGYKVASEEDAKEAVYELCEIQSRRDLDDPANERQRTIWNLLVSSYRAWELVGA